MQLRTPKCTHFGLGLFHFARRYFGNRVFFLFLRLLRCFSSPGSRRMTIRNFSSLFIHTSHEVCSCRFPHSEIHGSMDICSSPWLFAAYHVFHRLSVPRHPPCALIRLTWRLESPAGWFSSHMHSVACSGNSLCLQILDLLFACFL